MTADSGARGLQLLKEQPEAIDLVILDLTMPEQSGEQTLEQLRLVRSNLPVVITSGFQAEDASMLLKKPYVVGFLDKPHTMTSLEMLLASVTQRAPQLDAPAAGTTARRRALTAATPQRTDHGPRFENRTKNRASSSGSTW